MKKLLTWFAITSLGLVSLILLLFALLHTRYLTPSAQWLANHLWPQQITFQQLEYHYPLHFHLTQPTIYLGTQPLTFRSIDVWLNPTIKYQGKWQIDSVLFDGGTWSAPLLNQLSTQPWQLHQLAFRNLDYISDDFQLKGVSGHVQQPQWSPSSILPYGKVQLAVENLSWQQLKLDNLLINATYQTQNSTVHGFSFNWQGAAISGQAEHYPQGWSLINVTANRLQITPDSGLLSPEQYQIIHRYIFHINSLDVLNSDIQYAEMSFNNVSFSVENLLLNPSWWQQNSGDLSLNADSVIWHDLQWNEPTLKLAFHDHKVMIDEFSAELASGNIQFNGFITTDEIYLASLTVNRSRWLQEGQYDIHRIRQSLESFKTIFINELNLNNLQFLYLAGEPRWQISGLNGRGKNIELRRNNRWGLWNGDITLSANNASIGKTLTSQAILAMTSQDGLWTIHRGFLPLEHGYLDLIATWDLSLPSLPWQIQLHADGLPLAVFGHWYSLPLHLDALAEFTLEARGLAGDYAMLSHSLSGDLNGHLRQGIFSYQQDDALIIQPFYLDNLHIKADRGRLSLATRPLSGPALNAKLEGLLDLTVPQQARLEVQLWQDCILHQLDLWRNQHRHQSSTSCSAQPKIP